MLAVVSDLGGVLKIGLDYGTEYEFTAGTNEHASLFGHSPSCLFACSPSICTFDLYNSVSDMYNPVKISTMAPSILHLPGFRCRHLTGFPWKKS